MSTSNFSRAEADHAGTRTGWTLIAEAESDSGGNTVGKLDDPILQVLSDYKAAVFAKDVDRYVDLYDEDVLIFDMWGVWSYDGVAS